MKELRPYYWHSTTDKLLSMAWRNSMK